MRLPEDKIKEAILHPDPRIRERATRYFSKAFSSDPGIMPLVIQAVQLHGKTDAYHQIGCARDLRQSEDTITWVINELNDPQTDTYENYAFNLSMLLMEADPALLLPSESAILEARHFLPTLHEPFIERLGMQSWDQETCWQRLEEFCEAGKDKRYVNEVNLGYARCIVEALARFGAECEHKVCALLSEKVEDFHHHPMKWLEPLAVGLAGQAHLDSTIPLILAKLHEDADLLNEECAEALIRIGTLAVLEAVAEVFPTAEHHFRLYCTNPLAHIHSDLAVEYCLRFLAQEQDRLIQTELANALLDQFAHEGIEATRQLLIGQELDFQGRGLRVELLETCKLMGERFPEYEEWLATVEAEREEHWRRIKELEGDPTRMLLYALEKLTGQKTADVARANPPAPPPPPPPVRPLSVPRKPQGKQKIGRNDPCPCGSGKKFKKCCMPKQRGY